MTSKPNLALLSVIMLVMGLLISLFSALYLLLPTMQATPLRQNLPTSTGFAFAVTSPLIQNRTLFYLELNSINANQGTINATVRVTFQCREWAKTDIHFNGDYMYFLLQVPTQINDKTLTVHYHRDYQDPQYWGGTFSCQNGNGTDSISIVTVKIPTNNFSYSQPSYLTFNFEMKDAFTKINSFTYQLGIPFSADVGNYFDKSAGVGVQEITPISSRDSIVFRWVLVASLSVQQPDMRYFLSQIMPVSDGIHYYGGYTHYSWDVKALSTSFGSDSIVLTIEDNTAKDNAAKLEACGWLFLGLGIPTTLSSFLEFVREGRKVTNHPLFKKGNFKNWVIISCIGFTICITLALTWMYIYFIT
jgi:hypothetical protein